MRGLPITRCSILRSLFPRAICAFVSSPDLATGGVAGGRSSISPGGMISDSLGVIAFLYAPIATANRAGTGMPFPRCLRSVRPGRITGVDVRVDIGLCIGRHHPGGLSQKAPACDSEYSAFHRLPPPTGINPGKKTRAQTCRKADVAKNTA